MYTFLHAHTQVSTHLYTLTRAHTTLVSTHLYTFPHAHTHTLAHTCTHSPVHTHVCTHLYTPMHMHLPVHTPVHTHPCIHTCRPPACWGSHQRCRLSALTFLVAPNATSLETTWQHRGRLLTPRCEPGLRLPDRRGASSPAAPGFPF